MLKLFFTFHLVVPEGVAEGTGLQSLLLHAFLEFEEKVCIDRALVFEGGTHLLLFLQVQFE